MKILKRAVVSLVCWAAVTADAAPQVSVQPESTSEPKAERALEMATWSVDSGGGASGGGDFTLTAGAGQPDAGLISQCGTVLAGGLWAGEVDLQPIFCNGFESGGTGAWSTVSGGTK